MLAPGALLLAAWTAPAAPAAPRAERSGKEVVDTVCAACHAKGVDGAPRIGDAKAWAARASLGLTALTRHALDGIRRMPAHGGSPGVSEVEIERAITFMVNRSGGHWVEPRGGATPAVVRNGMQVVQAACARCHETGVDGAPRIGDRAAWIPRLSKGLDAVVRTAVHGHGGMPARGGVADLSDLEIQGAVVAMFNAGIPAASPPPPPPAADPYHKVVDGIDVYLGILRADAMPAASRTGAAPAGKDFYHLSISLFDARTKAPIPRAEVTLRVADLIRGESRTLARITAGNQASYGGYFRMVGADPYTIVAQVKRPGIAEPIEARFDYRVW